jgi:hypothetical protein
LLTFPQLGTAQLMTALQRRANAFLDFLKNVVRSIRMQFVKTRPSFFKKE